MRWVYLQIFLFLFPHTAYSQRKKVEIHELTENIVIDGLVNDPGWENATTIEDFIGFQPESGVKPSLKTKVRVTYDKKAIYFGAVMYDYPDSMRKRLTLRDNVDADNFIFHLSPYNDGTSWFEFWTTCSGVQMDVFIEPGGRNLKWDAVWESKVNIVDSGWIAEIRVPLAVLRIPKKEDQVWGFNMFRQVKWKNQVISWNLMNPDGPIGTYFYSTQQGELYGIKNIDPGTKLWFWPYASFYTEHNPERGLTKPIFQAGMDLKYGINESFNLDMIVIPDFNQVRIDDRVLNLTPFEIQYDEQRQFFHEGSDLFNKAGIFYSRRIGATPAGNKFIGTNLGPYEEITSQTESSRIINATKITGRTKKGLGLGFLNSMTTNEHAQIQDTVTGLIRNFKTQPFANYNVMVADQTFGKNSYLTLLNTNLIRKLLADEKDIRGNYYIANVTAIDSKIYTGSYVFTVYGAHSYKPIQNKYTSGYYYNLQFGKDNGEFRFLVNRKLYSENYDPNDMGYLKTGNIITNTASVSYNINKPFGIFLTFLNTLSLEEISQYRPNKFSDLVISHIFSSKLNNQWVIGFTQRYRPFGSYDFYEPRSPGRHLIQPTYYNPALIITTNRNKRFALGSGIEIQWRQNPAIGKSITFPFNLWIKLNDKFSFNYNFINEVKINDRGYVARNGGSGEIYFSRRDVNTIENILSSSYIFSPDAALDIRVRHYFSAVDQKQFYTLSNDGNLDSNEVFSDEDYYYDALTADISYAWRYKPGSALSVLLRHQVYNSFETDRTYPDAFAQTLETSGTTSISIKFLYYFDYNNIARR